MQGYTKMPDEELNNEPVTEQEPVDNPPVEDPPEWDAEVEQEARAFNWKPRSEWEGDVPAGFIDDPRRYMERAESFGPFRKLREQMETQTRQHNESLRKIEAITAAQVKRAREQAEEQYQRDVADISARQRKAVEEGDTEAWDRLEQQRGTIKPPEVEVPQPEPTDPLGDIRGQKGREWLNDPVLGQQAFQIVERALRSGALTTSDATQQVDFAEKELKRYYPHLFAEDTPKPKAASPVEGGGLAPSKKKSGFDSLPSDAKGAFKRMVGQGIFEDTAEDKEFYFNEYSNA